MTCEAMVPLPGKCQSGGAGPQKRGRALLELCRWSYHSFVTTACWVLLLVTRMLWTHRRAKDSFSEVYLRLHLGFAVFAGNVSESAAACPSAGEGEGTSGGNVCTPGSVCLYSVACGVPPAHDLQGGHLQPRPSYGSSREQGPQNGQSAFSQTSDGAPRAAAQGHGLFSSRL